MGTVVLAASDNKESAKSKRAYSLGYGYAPYTNLYDHDLYAHAPVASVSTVHHAAAPVVAHTPYISHAPYISPVAAYSAPYAATYSAPITAAYAAPVAAVHHAPIVAHAPLAKVTSSVYSSNIQHYPSSYYSASAPYYASAPYSAPYYAAPAAVVAHAPLLTEFHRR